LEKKERYFLKKDDKLKSRKAIETLFAQGKSFSLFPFKVFYRVENGPAKLQAGFAVSSRNFKKAVDRNRVKRLGRESYRLQKNNLSELVSSGMKRLQIFIIYTGKELPEYKLVYEKTGNILKRLIKIYSEHAETNS
jgi:ribonuclease P protein component